MWTVSSNYGINNLNLTPLSCTCMVVYMFPPFLTYKIKTCIHKKTLNLRCPISIVQRAHYTQTLILQQGSHCFTKKSNNFKRSFPKAVK